MATNQDKLIEIISEALAKAPQEERERYLAQACGEDRELRQQVDSLLQAQSEAVLKQTLGTQAYAAYQLGQDPLYRSAQSDAQQLGVPAASVMPIYEINRATQAEMNRIRSDDTLSSDEKVSALAQAQVQQQQALEELLGPEAFEKWLQAQGKRK